MIERIITTTAELKARCLPLHQEAFITVDTEFLREKTYYAQLCLIQIAGEYDYFAVDPLAEGLDMSAFWTLMGDEAVLKVFHACDQDLEILYQLHGKLPKPVFDTQIAARMLGYGETIGYGNLAERLLGEDIDKSSRFTDWSQRPLSDKQVDYALSDVTYLRDIYISLAQELKEKQRYHWAEEEMRLCADESNFCVNPEDAWLKIKTRGGKGEFLAAVKLLAEWRERRAQERDIPRYWTLRDDAILEIASVMPKNLKEIEGLRSYKHKNKEKTNEILELVKRAREIEPPEPAKRRKSVPKGVAPLAELLKILLKRQCDWHDVAPSTVASMEEVEEIARRLDPAEDEDLPCMRGWRFDVFGKYALKLKRGELALSAQGRKIVLLEPDVN